MFLAQGLAAELDEGLSRHDARDEAASARALSQHASIRLAEERQ
jgi:hypothetical protein